MGHSVIPEPSDEQRPLEGVVDDDEAFMEPAPIVLTGKEANDFADMILTRTPRRSEVLARAFARRRKTVVTE